MKLSKKLLVPIVIGIVAIIGYASLDRNNTTTFRELITENIQEDIHSIAIEKYENGYLHEFEYERIENQEEIQWIMDTLSDMELEVSSEGPPASKDIVYRLFIGAEYNLLNGFMFSKDGLIDMFNYKSTKTGNGSYQIINDFPLDFLDRYFK